ncbi:hypothetical protein ACS0TY_022963 [Phlomoides rotata]
MIKCRSSRNAISFEHYQVAGPQSLFLIEAALGVIWSLLWLKYATNPPRSNHPKATAAGFGETLLPIKSNQIDIFELVGALLVENCLAGFNSSVFAYGQTGSGKTYTIWGASNALLEEDQQGLAPRVFQRLFQRIDEEQVKQADRQLVYMCRCSFLEIYNEQITDLLDPSQKNLQVKQNPHLSQKLVGP